MSRSPGGLSVSFLSGTDSVQLPIFLLQYIVQHKTDNSIARKDPMTFEYFNTCPNLQTFNLIVTRFACNVHGTYHQVQKRFPNEPSIEPFGRANGFDQLVSMRGLKKITVTREQGEYAAPIATFPDSKLQALEDFLTQWVTQPKVIPRVSSHTFCFHLARHLCA